MKNDYLSRLILLILTVLVASPVAAQFTNFRKEEARVVLQQAKDEVRKHYYDTEYRGINLDAHFKKAEEKING